MSDRADHSSLTVELAIVDNMGSGSAPPATSDLIQAPWALRSSGVGSDVGNTGLCVGGGVVLGGGRGLDARVRTLSVQRTPAGCGRGSMTPVAARPGRSCPVDAPLAQRTRAAAF